MTDHVCIIPARGGSKRIPRKNLLDFCGKPMIQHSIEAAKESGLFARVIVSTDDEEISETASAMGAEVPFVRPAELSDDHAGTDAVLVHALKWLEENGKLPEYACCLYATAPFVLADDLKRGLEIIQEKSASTAFSVTTFPFPIFRGMKVSDAGRLEMFWPENRLKRSQDLEEAWHDAGQFYWINTVRYMKDPALFSSDSVPVSLPRWRVQDIDTKEDWERAERIYRAEYGSKL